MRQGTDIHTSAANRLPGSIRNIVLTTALCASMMGCTSPTEDIFRVSQTPNAPPNADPNACYARNITPAIVETVTQQVLVQPAQVTSDGRVAYPATYRTETRQEIVRDRTELWFETLCEELLSPDFIASLQRALAARGFYKGAVTGTLDRATKRAIFAYQAQEGLNSDVLALAAARRLGLSEIPRT